MDRLYRSLAAVAAVAFTTLEASARGAGIQNLALSRPVSVVSGSPSGAALSTLTDGLFLPAGTQWQTGTVWWSGTGASFQIDLLGASEVLGAIVQADNNDTYRMWYRDLESGSYLELWTIGAVSGAGMRTRPNPTDNTAIHYFASPVFTDSLRIAAIGGDSSYSLSEVQVWGIVPAPAAAPLLGLAGLIGAGRRRAR
jgi:hypothetical protein